MCVSMRKVCPCPRLFAGFLACLQLAFCLPTYAAQAPASVQAKQSYHSSHAGSATAARSSSTALVRLGGQAVITVPSGQSSFSAAQRARQMQENLDNSLVAASDRSPSTIKITYVKGIPVITLGGFMVTAVDSSMAKAAHTAPSVLAQRWVNSLRAALANKSMVNTYLAQLTGVGPAAQKGIPAPSHNYQTARSSGTASGFNQTQQASRGGSAAIAASQQSSSSSSSSSSAGGSDNRPYARARVVYIPKGLVMPMKLNTSLSSKVSRAGDVVVATLSDPVDLGNAVIPANTTITGRVTKSTTGAYLSKSGRLGIKFTSMRTPDGVETPISAHVMGSIGKFEATAEGSDEYRGETGETKIKKALLDTAIGAGSGALLGTTIGAIAGGGRGAGRGIIAGTALGAGAGLLLSYLQKGRDVSVSSDQSVKLQLDAPAQFSLASFSPEQL